MKHDLHTEQHLQLPRHARAELKAVVLARQLMKQAQMSDAAMADVEAALIETIINAFEHGESDHVDVHFRIAPEAFIVRVEDAGEGFGLADVERPDALMKRQRGETRGWGLAIMHRMMDRVDVHTHPDGTSITMIKNR